MIVLVLIVMSALLLLSQDLAHKMKLRPELKRKVFHISAAIFIAAWPWLISWRSIEILGLLMLAIIMANKLLHVFNFTKDLGRVTHGDIFLAMAVTICAYLSHNKLFFALALLNVALADGLAALAGQRYGRHYKYKVLHQPKTVIGTMTFWMASVCIFAVGLLLGHNQVSFSSYVYLVAGLPPLLALIENVSPQGLDNLSVPVAVVVTLNLLH